MKLNIKWLLFCIFLLIVICAIFIFSTILCDSSIEIKYNQNRKYPDYSSPVSTLKTFFKATEMHQQKIQINCFYFPDEHQNINISKYWDKLSLRKTYRIKRYPIFKNKISYINNVKVFRIYAQQNISSGNQKLIVPYDYILAKKGSNWYILGYTVGVPYD